MDFFRTVINIFRVEWDLQFREFVVGVRCRVATKGDIKNGIGRCA